MSLRTTTILFCVILAMSGPAVLAQTSFGSVNGTVTDASGGVIPGAAVTLVNLSTNIKMEAVTNDSGLFRLVNVRPGRYSLTIGMTGI